MNKDKANQALEIIARQRAVLLTYKPDEYSTVLTEWRDRTTRFLRDYIIDDELRLFAKISCKTYGEDKEQYLRFINELQQGIRNLPQQYLALDPLPPQKKPMKLPSSEKQATRTNRVFVVHGHDSFAKTDVARTLEKLGLEAIILHEQPNEGKTIIEKFERDATQVSFAVVILTPDDLGHPKNKPDEQKPRARQNVVLELGFFSGVLGRSNVCVLFKGDVEIPSDYLGVVYVNMDDGGAWRFNLAKELKQASLPVDLNMLV